MEINTINALFALVLLWPPTYLFISSRTRRRIRRAQGKGGDTFPLVRLALTWQNWFDLARGLAGSWLLYNQSFSVDPEMENAEYLTPAILAAVLLVGAVFQVLYYRRKWYCFSPLFYLVGVTFGILVWWIALYGLLAGLFFVGLLRHAIVFLAAMAATIGISGFLIMGFEPEWATACALLLLPIILSLILRRDLMPVVRKQAAAEDQ